MPVVEHHRTSTPKEALRRPCASRKTRNPLETPMIRQFLQLKAAAGDCILFFRMGDFYEMFLEDAQKAAPILGLTLTSRNKGNPDEIPLCGFPHPALNDYLAKMITEGIKVAICEQVEEEKDGKKFFRREISRIVTPGLVTQGEQSLGPEAHRSRYLAAIFAPENLKKELIGFSYLDISTGEFRVCEIPYGEKFGYQPLIDEIARLAPSEILLPEGPGANPSFLQSFPQISVSPVPFLEATDSRIKKDLCSFFGTQSLDGFGLKQMTCGLGASKAILDYVQETQREKVSHICSLLPYGLDEFLFMDSATRRNLELTRNLADQSRRDTLLAVLDCCLTRQGSRLLEQWISSPLMDVDQIEKRQSVVQTFYQEVLNGNPQMDVLEETLKGINDLDRICSRISLGTLSPRDCIALYQSIFAFPTVLKLLESFIHPEMESLVQPLGLNPLQDLAQKIKDTISEDAPALLKNGGVIREGFHPPLDELRLLMRDTKGFISEIEQSERQKTGIGSLKVRFNKVFGYYIEITKSYLDQVPDYFIRKQTLVNAERFIVPELKEFEEKLLHAEENAHKMENQIFQDLRQYLQQNIEQILSASKSVAKLDILFAFGRNAVQWNYCRPEIIQENIFHVEENRHAVLERIVKSRQKEQFVPNDIVMDGQSRQILLITGPNMAGKSTVMRQLALTVIMAQCGSFVPAKKATLGLVDGLFTRVGASDSLSLGQSTFMVEMNETANILHNASKRSLIILDEIGRGTSTYDGLSIAWAVAEYIHNQIGARTLFATHYHELADLPKTLNRVRNCNIAVKEWNDQIIFLRKLMDGATNRSYGIQVARLAGVPEEVLKRSKEILNDLQEGELDETGFPNLAQGKNVKKRGGDRSQFDLFGRTEEGDLGHQLTEEVRRLNVNQMTPLDALNILFSWSEKVHKKS